MSLLHDASKFTKMVAEIVITMFSVSSVRDNSSSPVDVNSLKSIGCTFIIFSTMLDSNFLLFIFFQPFYEVMIIFFHHKNGSRLSLRGSEFTLPSFTREPSAGQQLCAQLPGQTLSTVFGLFEAYCCQEALGTYAVMMGHAPHIYPSLFYMLSFKPS